MITTLKGRGKAKEGQNYWGPDERKKSEKKKKVVIHMKKMVIKVLVTDGTGNMYNALIMF